MKVIIVEDEILAQQELSWLIKTHSQMEIVGTFEDGLDVLKFLQHNRVDAIFLDINIPSLDGVLLAQNINQFAHKPFIVFVTAWKEHAVEAFELEAFDYILKPYQESRIVSMLQKLEQVKPLMSMLASARDGASLTDVAAYLAVMLEATGKKVDRLEVLQSLSAPDSSSVDHVLMEILRAAMPNLFEKSVGKAEPQPAAKKKPATKRKAG